MGKHPIFDDAGDELGDKLAWALGHQDRQVSHTIHLRSLRRPWWWRLLPWKRCPSCGARVYRTDPDGQPSRVWWCGEHGPLERPLAAR
jgi:hypothetical protein